MRFTGERYVPEEVNKTDELSVEHLHRYHSILPLTQSRDVLDIACGEGYGTALIAGMARSVVGVDISEECILHASSKYNNSNYPNLRFERGDVKKIPASDASFDAVVSFETIEHVSASDQQIFLSEARRVLREDGIFIISTPDIENYSERFDHLNSFHLHELSREEFKNILTNEFSNVTILEQGFDIVSLITPTKNTNNENLRIINWQSSSSPKKRKYLIAIASNKPIEKDIASIVLHTDKDYFKQLDRIVALQDEVERLGKWGQSLDKERLQNEAEIKNLKEELKDKERLIQDTQFNSSLTRQQLNEVNNRLVTIYDSDGWKLLNKYYNLKGKYLNENSALYKVLKKFFNFFRLKKNGHRSPAYPKNKIATASSAHGGNRSRQFPSFGNPLVSIIVPVYNGWSITEQCLMSIIENTHGISYEVIIADDCSSDKTKNIADIFTNAVHVRNEKNLGFLLNCNNAASHARGKYLHFLNNDTVVRQGWLNSLSMLLDKDESIGLVGSKLIYPDGRLQEAGGIIWQDASGWNFGNGQNPEMPEFNYVKEVDYISGASIMIRKSLWDALEGFDPHYSPAYCEDSDIAFRIREKGFKVVYQPLSEVIHHEGYSHGNDKAKSAISSIKKYQKINNAKFSEKWNAELKKEHFPNGENVFWARDRRRHKKTLLMIDHYVPHFDRDAGSRTTFQYLELFVKMGFNVKFLGENFYKHEPYTTILQQMGIEVLYGPWYADNWQRWFKDHQQHIDYVYLNRPHVSINFIDFIRQNSKARIIYYGHDLHFLRKQKKYELEKDESLLEKAAKWKEIELYLFGKSDIILTPSIEEQKIIQSLDSDYNVQLMRPYIYKTVSAPTTNFQQRKDLFFVGGFAHSPNVDGILWFVNEVWPIVRSQLPGVRFIIAGSNPPPEIKELAVDSTLEIKGYVGDDELEQLYASSKMAVIPLRYGAGVKGKTVEAMRYGTPLVTTNFGVEGLPGDYSFLKVANTPAELARLIVDSYNNEQELEEMSRKNIEYIENNFTEEIATDIIRNVLACT